MRLLLSVDCAPNSWIAVCDAAGFLPLCVLALAGYTWRHCRLGYGWVWKLLLVFGRAVSICVVLSLWLPIADDILCGRIAVAAG